MSKQILQLDDEPGISSALRMRLGAAGFEVVSASNGRSGLEAAEAHKPDAILLDIRMPDMDGFEVCRRLKSNPRLADIPVIFLSANVKDEAREMAHEVGGSVFLAKPYDAKDILTAIEQAIVKAH